MSFDQNTIRLYIFPSTQANSTPSPLLLSILLPITCIGALVSVVLPKGIIAVYPELKYYDRRELSCVLTID
jgi:hypothetical protein